MITVYLELQKDEPTDNKYLIRKIEMRIRWLLVLALLAITDCLTKL